MPVDDGLTTQTFVVSRPGENLVAIVEADIPFARDQFLERLRKVLTEWRDTTAQGLQAWNYSCGDFNVGDLASYQNDPDLIRLLQKAEITCFEVNTIAPGGYEANWTYDTVLIDDPDPLGETADSE